MPQPLHVYIHVIHMPSRGTPAKEAKARKNRVRNATRLNTKFIFFAFIIKRNHPNQNFIFIRQR